MTQEPLLGLYVSFLRSPWIMYTRLLLKNRYKFVYCMFGGMGTEKESLSEF